MKKRYAHVGLGSRADMFTEAICDTYKSTSEYVGLCDTNQGRMDFKNKEIATKYKHAPVPTYSDKEFDKMIKEQKPDVVIVTCKDVAHDFYICRAMELGCDVITEKPMTIDEKKCQKIVDTAKRTKRNVRVTFNYRYSPPRSQIKELLMNGVIGKVLSVDFHWMLNTSHGADYFRRWHRQKANSGGLMVHKSTHHFDLVNWWLSAKPTEVFAMGDRLFYGDKSGVDKKLGLDGHGERCLDCKKKKACKFYLDIKGADFQRNVYLNNEKYDGYFRDKCVFGKNIDIEDTMNVIVKYNTGAFMSYSLNAFLPWEGYKVVFNGTKGRLEHDCVESVYISGDNNVPGETIPEGTNIRLYPHFKPAKNIKVNSGKGGHGGGDTELLKDIFMAKPPADKYLRSAGFSDGAMSILTGIAANKSFKTKKLIKIDSLVKGIPDTKMTAMKEW